MTPLRLLTIAGSDSSGGAGVQADLKTFSALGGYGMSVITALTAQNTVGVTGIYEVPPDFVVRQMDAVMSDIGADAVKIGMLFSAAIVEVVAERLRQYRVRTVVLDPVMVATSGDRLLREDAVGAMCAELLPLADVITPNLPEAELLLGGSIGSETAMEQAAVALLDLGPRAALVKGGHFTGEDSRDVLALQTPTGRACLWLSSPRIDTPNTHGTGCTLSSALTAYLGQGLSMEAAAHAAKAYIDAAIEAGAACRLGCGHGPVQHFHAWWRAPIAPRP